MGDNWLNKKVQNTIAGAGSTVGGVAYGVGNGINSAGRGLGNSIANTTRYWGQGIAGYGNNIKDSSKAGGPRKTTAGNPLGLSGVGSSKVLAPGGKLPAGTTRNTGKGAGSNPLGL